MGHDATLAFGNTADHCTFNNDTIQYFPKDVQDAGKEGAQITEKSTLKDLK